MQSIWLRSWCAEIRWISIPSSCRCHFFLLRYEPYYQLDTTEVGHSFSPHPQVILELLNPLNFKSDTHYSKEKLAWIPVFLSLFFRLEFLYEVSIVGNVSYVEDDKIIYKWDWWRISCIWSVLKHFPSGEDPLSWSASDGLEEILYPLTNNRAIYLKLIHTQTRWYSPLRRNEQYLIRRRYIVS